MPLWCLKSPGGTEGECPSAADLMPSDSELKQPEQLLYFLPLGQTRKGSLPVQRQYQSKGKHWWQFAVNLH